MTKQTKQGLAVKRKSNHLSTEETSKKKSKPTQPSCVIVDQLLSDRSISLSAHANLARCLDGGGKDDPPDVIDEFFAGDKNLNDQQGLLIFIPF